MKKFLISNIPKKLSHVKLDIGLSYNAPQSHFWLKMEKKLLIFGFEPNPEAIKRLLIEKNYEQHKFTTKDYFHEVTEKFTERRFKKKRKRKTIFLTIWLYREVLRYFRLVISNVRKKKTHQDIIHKYYKSRFFLIPVALSNVETEQMMDFYVNSNDCGTSSLYKHDEKFLGPIKNVIKVPVVSLKMFFDTFLWERFEYIDHIKIDAQGSDLNILKGAGDYLKEKVVYVTAEPDGKYYFGARDCNKTSISNYMISQNFLPVNHPNTNDPTFINKKFLHLKDKIYIFQN